MRREIERLDIRETLSLSVTRTGGKTLEHSGEKLDIGRTLGFAMETMGAKALPFAALLLIVTAFNALLDTYAPGGGYFLSTFPSLAVSVLGSYFALKVRCGDDLTIKLAFGRALGVSILSGLGILVGLLLLIVPGFYLLACWAVAIPALLAEDLGVSQALSRSKDLSEGNKIALLGLMGLIWVPIFLIVVGGGFLAGMFFGEGVAGTLAYNSVLEFVSTFAAVLSTVLLAEAYISLSGLRDRLGTLREVFA